MRWMVSLVVLLLLLPLVPTHSWAQEPPPVPLTITIPDANHNITRIDFPDPGDRDTTREGFLPRPVRTQYLARYVEPDLIDGRYRFTTVYYLGSSPIPRQAITSFAPTDLCGEEGQPEIPITRIACSVVEKGRGVTCSAWYDRGTIRDECTSTQACTRCNGLKVCGSDPRCD